MNDRKFASVYANYFSEESNVKHRKIEVEERKLSAKEKDQVIEMVKAGIYSPRSARRKIEDIDSRTRSHADHRNPPDPIQSPPTPHGRFQTLSPSPGYQSPRWDAGDSEGSLNDTEDNI